MNRRQKRSVNAMTLWGMEIEERSVVQTPGPRGGLAIGHALAYPPLTALQASRIVSKKPELTYTSPGKLAFAFAAARGGGFGSGERLLSGGQLWRFGRQLGWRGFAGCRVFPGCHLNRLDDRLC